MTTGTKHVLVAGAAGLIAGVIIGVLIQRGNGQSDMDSEDAGLAKDENQDLNSSEPLNDDTEKEEAGINEVVYEVIDEEPLHEPIGSGMDVLDDSFPLQLGSTGHRIERLQVFLMRHFGLIVKPTGVFDKSTLEIVRKYMNRDSIDEPTYNRFEMDKMVHDQRVKLR